MYRGDLASYVINVLVEATIITMKLLFGLVLPTLNSIALWLTELGLGLLRQVYPRLSAAGAVLASVLSWTVAALLFLPVLAANGVGLGEALAVLLGGGALAGLLVGGQITQYWHPVPVQATYLDVEEQQGIHSDMLVPKAEETVMTPEAMWNGGVIIGKTMPGHPHQ